MPRLWRAGCRCPPAGSRASTGVVADGVDAALDHAVAAPHEEEVGTAVDRLADAVGRELALGHLEPRGVVDAGRREYSAELGEPASEGLAGVCDHCDGRHWIPSGTRWNGLAVAVGSRSSRRRCAAANPALTAMYATVMHPAPMRSPQITSVALCMPR